MNPELSKKSIFSSIRNLLMGLVLMSASAASVCPSSLFSSGQSRARSSDGRGGERRPGVRAWATGHPHSDTGPSPRGHQSRVGCDPVTM